MARERRQSGSGDQALQVPADICVEIFCRLPRLQDKLAFACVCRGSRAAASDSRCWQTVDVTAAVEKLGETDISPSGHDFQSQWIPFAAA